MLVNLGGLMDGLVHLRKVLLVDDDDLVRLTIGRVLEMSGFDVTSAATVPEALRLIFRKHTTFCCLICTCREQRRAHCDQRDAPR